MLKCRDVAEHGSHFIDRNIPWYRLPGWYLHLFLCGNCRRFLRHLHTTVRVVRGLPRQPASASDVAEVMAHIPSETSKAGTPDPRRD